MKIYDCEQYSPAWWEARKGIATASNLDKIITSKLEPSKQALKYAYELAAETVSGVKEKTYTNANMKRGIELEAEARKFLELRFNATINQTGFIVEEFAENNQFGCSPDGLIGDDVGIEIKCPLPSTHVNYLLNENHFINDYFLQCVGSLLVTKRKKWILCSYYPGLKEKIVEIEHSKSLEENVIKKIIEFNELKNKTIAKIKGDI